MKTRKLSFLWEISLIVVLTALAYLPNIRQASFFRDDWYYIMDAHRAGEQVFHTMFSIDRPARGAIFETLYGWFGMNPTPYHLMAYLWRLLGGLAALWLFRLLWPGRRAAALCAAALFAIYPGYVWWVEPLEYQPMVMSAALQALSFALTLQALRSRRTGAKAALAVVSIFSGLGALLLVDYAIGMEAFRVLIVYSVVSRSMDSSAFLKKVLATLKAWAVYLLAPLSFLIWRMLIFRNTRSETDVASQLGKLIADPLHTGLIWLVRLLQSSWNVAVMAWGTQLYRNILRLRLSDTLICIGLGAAAVGLILLVLWLSRPIAEEEAAASGQGWQVEAVWMGLAGVLLGVLPVIAANRYIVFDAYSHYTLPASLAAAAFATGLVFSLSSRSLRALAFASLAAVAVMTHYTVSNGAVDEEKSIAQVWQQVAWRAPDLQDGTTLFVNYGTFEYGEDISVAWGPANLIYEHSADLSSPAPVPVPFRISSLQMMNYNVQMILSGDLNRPLTYRTHTMNLDVNHLLVISRPTVSSCAHVLDGRWPRYSDQETPRILAVGSFSKIDQVVTGAQPPSLPALLGPEPAHGWCYYYEKAELAVQKQDWAEVRRLGSEADRLKLHANDEVEWMPFLQAYAALGETDLLKVTAAKTGMNRFLKNQACQSFQAMQKMGVTFPTQSIQSINLIFCGGMFQ